MNKIIAYVKSSLRQLIHLGLPLLICFYIVHMLDDFNTRQILSIGLIFILYPKVKAFIATKKLNKSITYFNFNDAVANELMRMQFKLNELVNFNNPRFEIPKEMQYHPATMFDFRTFVQYWQAYSAYPETAACELLDYSRDQEEKYELCLMIEGEELEGGKIYLSNIDDKIAYSMIAIYNTSIQNKLTDIKAPSEFTLDSLKKFKRDIIKFAFAQGHLEIAAIIILKKTDGLRYYDPFNMMNNKSVTSQDLINLNSGEAPGYINISAKKNTYFKAYVYNSEHFSLLEPDESEIRIISVEKDPYQFERDKIITIEIQQTYGDSPYHIPYTGEKRGDPVIRTIRYADL